MLNPERKPRGWKQLGSRAAVGGVILGGTLLLLLWLWGFGPSETSERRTGLQATAREIAADPLRFATNRFSGGIGTALAMDSGTGLPSVHGVIPGSPAEKAGLQKGDILLEINRLPTRGKPLVQIVEIMRGFTGGSVSLLVERGGTNLQCVVYRTSWNTLKDLGNFD